MRSSSRRQSLARASIMCTMRGDRTSVRVAKDLRKPGSQEAQPLTHGNAALQQKGANLHRLCQCAG